MKVLRIREGFATNSSSVHSIIITDKPLTDYLVEEGEFGWDPFIAASENSKRLYMACQLYKSLLMLVPEEAALALAEKYAGIKMGDAYVDHQSVFDLPTTFKGNYPHIGFFNELLNYVLNPNIAIKGGNDNSYRYVDADEVLTEIPKDGYGSLVARKDSAGYWVLFDRRTGKKIHFTFDPEVKAGRASSPELVDLKITDFCTKGCKYCYQDSSLAGKHAISGNIYSIFRALKDLEVFEVAIGGGEPLYHPDFISIIRDAEYFGLTVNFSTGDITWLNSPEMRQEILPRIGSFAYSVSSASQVERLGKILDYYRIGKSKLLTRNAKATVQVIPAFTSKIELEKILTVAHKYGIACTLLGVKEAGRGAEALKEYNKKHKWEVKDRKPSYWLNVVNSLRDKNIRPHIGIDTSLAQTSKEALVEANIPTNRYYTKEGMFSMYIDAVEGKMGPSSFCNEDEMVPIISVKPGVPSTKEQILKAFKSF